MTWANVIEAVEKFWLQFFLTGLSGLVITLFKKINSMRKEQKKEKERLEQERIQLKKEQEEQNELIKTAVRSLLRDRLFMGCHHFLELGSITTSEMENLSGLFEAYQKLNGNGVAKTIYHRLQEHCKLVVEDHG